MTDVKINASFILPGRVLPAEPHLLKNVKRKRKEKEEKKENEILYRQETVRLKSKTIVVNLREGKPAKQNVNLSYEAYNFMTSPDNPIKGIKVFEWKRLTKNKRVKFHLQVLGESLGGKLEEFKILED